MSTFDEPTNSVEEADDRGPGLSDSDSDIRGDIDGERPDGSGGEGASATTTGDSDGSPAPTATGEDVERGNADGSTAHAAPRADALDDAQSEWAEADRSNAMGESGQDNGLNE